MLNVDNLKITCINEKETNVKFECAKFSRIFVIKKNIILIFDNYILINDDKVEIVANHAAKYKNSLIFNDHENIYKICFDSCEITRFYLGNLKKGDVLGDCLGFLTKDGLYRLFSDHKGVFELSDVKDFEMKYYVLKGDGKWYNKEECLEGVFSVINTEFGPLLILEDKMLLNSNCVDNELFYGDFESKTEESPVFYACTFDEYILVVSSIYSSVCLYSKDLEHIDQSGNLNFIYVRADSNNDPIYLRGIDSSEDLVATIDMNGKVTTYKVEGIESREDETVRFTSVNSYKIADNEFILCNDINKEVEDIFHYVMENEDSVLTDNSFTVHDKTKNIKMDIGDLGYDSLNNFDRGNSEELSDASSPSISSIKYSDDTTKKSDEEDKKEKEKSLEEPSLDISNLFAPQKSDTSSILSATKETKIQKPTISFSKEFLGKNSTTKKESFLNLSQMNITNKPNVTSNISSKNDEETTSKDDQGSGKMSHSDLKNLTFSSKNSSQFESGKYRSSTEKDTSTPLRSKSYTNLSIDKVSTDNTLINKDNIKTKLRDVSRDLEHNVDDIINQINSIKVNNDSINCYKLNTSKIPKIYDELYQNIMRLEDVNKIKQNIESNLLAMIDHLDLHYNFDEAKVKNSISYFDEVIERKETSNLLRPMCYDEPIVDDIELSLSSLKIYNKIKEKKDNDVLSKINLEPFCSLKKNTVIDASSISFISLENETKCEDVKVKEKDKTKDEVQKEVMNSKSYEHKQTLPLADNQKDLVSSATTFLHSKNTNFKSSLGPQTITPNLSSKSTTLESTNFLQNTSRNNLSSIQPSIFDKTNVIQNTTPVMSNMMQSSNIFSGGKTTQMDFNRNSSEVFSKIVNSGASIPVIKKTEPQNDSKPPSAFSKFASNHTLFK